MCNFYYLSGNISTSKFSPSQSQQQSVTLTEAMYKENE